MANTGYKVTLYIDDNPNSSGYGQTWTEREWDASHCPVDGHWTEITSLCEATTSGYTGYKTTVYYNELTGQYSSTTVYDSSCPNSSMDELWIDSGDPFCEMDEEFLYTGYQVQHQVQRNSNLLNYGEERDERTPSSACSYTIEPVWEEIYRTCHVIAHETTGELTFDGTAEVLQIDTNPSSSSFNETRTVVEESEECNYVQCEETTNEWVYQGDYCGTAIPEEWFSGATPDTLYEVYRLYINCLVNGEVIKSSPTDFYSGVTSETGVTDCVERWVETDETVCEYSTPYTEKYLTFVALEPGSFTYHGSSGNTSIQYSIDSGNTWEVLQSNTASPSIQVNNSIMFKGNLIPFTDTDDEDELLGVGYFSSTCRYKVEGNIMSLLYGDNFEHKTSLADKNYAFFNLFSGSTNLVSAENLELPAITLGTFCYNGMFYRCTSLTTAPVLPTTTLAYYCYGSMFNRCTSLTTAPALPATTLAEYCYSSMFGGCTSLTTAPALPAETLADYCYQNMFQGCTSLTTAPVLSATTLAQNCYSFMFAGCTSLTTAPVLPATTLSNICYGYMFSGCTSLTTAPVLSATTLANSCYQNMFQGCTSLTTAPALPATTLTYHCYGHMFQGCTSLTTAPELPATTAITYCYSSMFAGCTSLTTAPALPATTLSANCYSYMFEGCTSLTTAPALSATTLDRWCYQYMFAGCSSLNSITCLATDISATSCLTNWVSGVAANGTFTKAASMTSWPTGANGIPNNWTIQNA